MPPPLIIITDSFPQANGAGISQTLFRLFKGYDGKLYVLHNGDEAIATTTDLLNATAVVYQFPNWLKPIQNRLGIATNRIIKKIRQSILEKRIPFQRLPDCKNAWVLVSTTVEEKIRLAEILYRKGYTVVPYFMDDWMADLQDKKTIDAIGQILKAAPGRMMISDALKAVLEDRYALPPADTLVIHNPAPAKMGPYSPVDPANHRTLVYAGSIWPMHADALIATAAAISRLHKNDDRWKLIVYAPVSHWQQYRNSFHQYAGVLYGGWLPANQMRLNFLEAGLLLACASFSKALQNFSQTSVQTKLTDYLAAGRPLVMVAPANAASAQFVQQYQVGYCIATNNPVEIGNQLLEMVADCETMEKNAYRAWIAATQIFNEDTITLKINSFFSLLEKEKVN